MPINKLIIVHIFILFVITNVNIIHIFKWSEKTRIFRYIQNLFFPSIFKSFFSYIKKGLFPFHYPNQKDNIKCYDRKDYNQFCTHFERVSTSWRRIIEEKLEELGWERRRSLEERKLICNSISINVFKANLNTPWLLTIVF